VEGVGFAGDEHGRRKPYSLRAARPLEQGRLIGQKRPLKPKDVWTVRVRLQLEGRKRDLAMFNLAIDSDSKLRDCHLIRVRINDVRAGGRVRDRATVVQTKTQLAGYMRFAQAIVWDGVWQRASCRSVAPAADSNNGSTPWS
jgi:hypothetical protein